MRVVIQDNYEKMSLWAADYIAKKLQIDEVYAEVLPDGKAEIIKEIQQKANVYLWNKLYKKEFVGLSS